MKVHLIMKKNISIECDNCCIYKYNYPDWDQNNDGVLDNYSDYEFSATFHLTVKNQINPITSDIVINENDMLAAFSNGEIRGVAKATYNSLLLDDTYLFILMGYSNNQSGDMISFKYYDYESDEVFDLNENIEFISDMSLANALTPYELSVVGSAYPDWTFYYPFYEFNSSLVATLKIGDNYMGYNNQDILSVFINDEPRGYCSPTIIPFGPLEGVPSFNLMYYGDQLEIGNLVTFKYFEADSGQIYELSNTVPFMINDVVGDMFNPLELSINESIDVSINFYNGWNWFSLNAIADDMSVGSLFGSIPAPNSFSLLKSQTGFTNYYSSFSTWFPNYFDLADPSWPQNQVAGGAYPSCFLQALCDIPDNTNPIVLEFSGTPVDLSTPININNGQTWISYYPTESMLVDDALSSLSNILVQGDNIKSQTATTTYYAEYDVWFPEFYMNPNEGYMLNISQSGILVYPESTNALASNNDFSIY